MKLQAGSWRLEGLRLYLGDDNKPPIKFRRKEARLLAILMRHPGQVVNRATLMREVWQTDYLGDTRTLDVHICLLRQKLEEDPTRPQLLLTERGVGYRLNVPGNIR
jgi:DNA-binding response OmpR family regulator